MTENSKIYWCNVHNEAYTIDENDEQIKEAKRYYVGVVVLRPMNNKKKPVQQFTQEYFDMLIRKKSIVEVDKHQVEINQFNLNNLKPFRK